MVPADDHSLSEDCALPVTDLHRAYFGQADRGVDLTLEVAQPGTSLGSCRQGFPRRVGVLMHETGRPTQGTVTTPLSCQALGSPLRVE
eukprot:7293291-Heterocapsa_arctica.AAC.1